MCLRLHVHMWRSLGCWSGIVGTFLGLSQGNQCGAKASLAFHMKVDAVIFIAQRFPGGELRIARTSVDTPAERSARGELCMSSLGNFYSTGLSLRIEFFRSVCAIWCLLRDMRAGSGSLLVCWWLVFNVSLGGSNQFPEIDAELCSL